jgi:hypothetical protein
MSSDDTLNRVSRPNSSRGGRGGRKSDRDTTVYVEDGWIFRVKPGAPIECVRATGRTETPSQVESPRD